MPPCEAHFVEKCPVCKNHIKAVSEVAPTFATAFVVGQPQVTNGEPLVHIPNAHPQPEITDPQAKNVLQLAREHAQALDDVANMKSVVANLRSMLGEAVSKLAEAEENCKIKQEMLLKVISPIKTPQIITSDHMEIE